LKLVRPPLEKFYNSLSDEQKARFNAIGPDLGKDSKRTARSETQNQQADCGGEKAGLTPCRSSDREVVQPSVAQAGALDRLSERWTRQCRWLQSACPTTIPPHPVAGLRSCRTGWNDDRGRQHVRPALGGFLRLAQ